MKKPQEAFATTPDEYSQLRLMQLLLSSEALKLVPNYADAQCTDLTATAGQWRIVEYLVRSNATQPHARLTGPSFELQIARAKAVPVEVRPITNPPWRSAAIPCISPGLRRGAGGRGPRLRRSHRYAQPELQQWVSRGG